MTHIYFSVSSNVGTTTRALDLWRGEPLNMLVAYPYLNGLRRHLARWSTARMMLDSGAFSAWQSGREVDINALARESMTTRWTETVGLDVIGSWQGSKQNAIRLKTVGSPAMPVFHVGDPWDLLSFYCANWAKVGLGGMVGAGDVTAWLDKVFAYAWPHRFHAFGQTSSALLLRYPFHSADSTTWWTPAVFASGLQIRGSKVGCVRGCTNETLASGVCYSIQSFIDLASRLRMHWRTELVEMQSTREYTGD